jgi:hypothetical protein
MPGDGFVTSDQWKNARRLTRGRRTKIMSHDTDTIRSAAADAAADLSWLLLVTDLDVVPDAADTGELRDHHSCCFPHGAGTHGSGRLTIGKAVLAVAP